MPDQDDCPNPLAQRDAIALIGLTATLNGLVLAGDIHPQQQERLASRLRRDGLIPAGSALADGHELSASLDALNQRLRWVLGEYDAPAS